VYDGTEYNECAPDSTGAPWCATVSGVYESGVTPWGVCLGPERCFYWGADCCEGHEEEVDGSMVACGYTTQHGCVPGGAGYVGRR
jgi:hypothetical protein